MRLIQNMNMQKILFLTFCIVHSTLLLPAQPAANGPDFKQMAAETLDSVYSHYGVQNTELLRENYPFNEDYQASYLAEGREDQESNPYSYLWPFSGSLSAQVALYELEKNPDVLEAIDQKVLPGLEEYYDRRQPHGYASYIQAAPTSDRFYDDNVWLGIDFTDLYLQSGNKKYLQKAEEIWTFVESGMDDKLGGGIYWYEQQKTSKNTCSNAPGVVFLVKLYQATKAPAYLQQAKDLYAWTKNHLEDPEDHLYYDNINLSGRVDETKYPYNSGQMLQAATLLYQITQDEQYLQEAQAIAESGHDFFFHDSKTHSGGEFRLLKNSDLWFIAVMLRGYIELYKEDKNPVYLESFRDNLAYAWTSLRDDAGLFNKDWTNQDKPAQKWLLDQCAMVEMYARLAAF